MPAVIGGRGLYRNDIEISVGSMNKVGFIVSRQIIPPSIGEEESTIILTPIVKAYFKADSVKGSQRFGGVDVGVGVTHIFTTRFHKKLRQLDAEGEHFVKMGGVYFKIISIVNHNQQDKWLSFQCEERGLTVEEATGA